MNAHTLFARCLDGSILEIGSVRTRETAARIRHALERELGDEYVAFWIEEELEVTCRALTRDELRPQPRVALSARAAH